MEWRVISCVLLCGATAAGSDAGELRIDGNVSIASGELAEHLQLRGLEPAEASRWRPEDFRRAADSIEALYRSRGYPLARADCEPGPGSEAGCRLTEGPSADLEEVEIIGGSGQRLDELSHLFPLGERYDPAGLDGALIGLEGHFHDKGFPHARARLLDIDVVEVDGDRLIPLPFREAIATAVRARVQVVEGPLFRFGTVRAPADVAGSVSLPVTGAPFSRSATSQLRESVARYYHDRGKVLKKLLVLEHERGPAGRIDLEVRAVVYPDLIVSRIEFKGNSRYPDDFYRRELRVDERTIFDPRKLDQSLRRLAATGTLQSISGHDVELSVDPNYFEVALKITLHERKPHTVAYSLGSDPLGGLGISAFYSVANLLGLGERLGLEVSAGDQTSSLAVGLASRYLLGTGVPLGMALQFFSRRTGVRLSGLDNRFRRLLGSRQEGLGTQLSYRISERRQLGIEASAARFESGGARRGHFVLAPSWRQKGPAAGDFFRVSERFSIFSRPEPSWNLRHTLTARRQVGSPAGGLLSVGLHAGHASFFGAPPAAERLFFEPLQLRGLGGVTSGPWATIDGRPAPIGGDTLLAVSGDYRLTVKPGWDVIPFVDTGWNGSLVRGTGLPGGSAPRGVTRTSLGTELRARPLAGLPATRLIFAFNPLRLASAPGERLGRFVDPAFRFRIAVEP